MILYKLSSVSIFTRLLIPPHHYGSDAGGCEGRYVALDPCGSSGLGLLAFVLTTSLPALHVLLFLSLPLCLQGHLCIRYKISFFLAGTYVDRLKIKLRHHQDDWLSIVPHRC